jgi:hypothetical protein
VRRNFPFRERLINLDADYLHAINAVSSAPDLKAYYRELQIFLARLQDGHTFVQLPKGMFMTKSRPAMGVTRIGKGAVVTWVRSDLAAAIPLGSMVQKVWAANLMRTQQHGRAQPCLPVHRMSGKIKNTFWRWKASEKVPSPLKL